jgi:hypothetical protein
MTTELNRTVGVTSLDWTAQPFISANPVLPGTSFMSADLADAGAYSQRSMTTRVSV